MSLLQMESLLTFKDRLIFLMEREGIKTQYALAQEIGENPKTVNHWWTIRAKIPNARNIEKLAQRFGVDAAWLRYGSSGEGAPLPGKPARRVKVLKRITKQFPDVPDEDIDEHLNLPDIPLDSFAIKMSDESMVPVIHKDDYVIFTASETPAIGKLIVLVDEWGETLVRRYREKDGQRVFVAENKDFPILPASKKRRAVGLVVDVWSRRKF